MLCKHDKQQSTIVVSLNWLYAQLHFSQLLVSSLLLLDKLINSGVPDLSSQGNNNQTHLN